VIVTADWVVPVSGPPIRDGAVLVHGRTIAEVGTRSDLCARHGEVPLNEHPGCVIIPGLVNAHTHLSLTALAGLVPPMPFAEWLARITPAIRAMTHDDLTISAAMGAWKCIATGATVVGDITYGPEDLAAAGDAGVGGVFFWEVLGLAPSELIASLERREFPLEARECAGGRSQCALAPHAPYSAEPGLIRAAHALTRERGARMMIHVGESLAETRLLTSGGGALAQVAGRLMREFAPPRTGSVRYLDSLGVLEDTIAVHCVHLASGEVELLARKARGVVLCPRSNRYLENGDPPVAELRSSGARIALGTDSLGSNHALDLFAEARALQQIDPGLESVRLLEIMTLEGAGVLGLDALFGSLEPGKQADLAVIALGETEDPVGDLIAHGAPERVRAVASAGVWRLLDGRSAMPLERLRQENARVAVKAALIAEHPGHVAAHDPHEQGRSGQR
jgi:cytosine/adenosine deaminase-related metal-dependent hydrolase